MLTVAWQHKQLLRGGWCDRNLNRPDFNFQKSDVFDVAASMSLKSSAGVKTGSVNRSHYRIIWTSAQMFSPDFYSDWSQGWIGVKSVKISCSLSPALQRLWHWPLSEIRTNTPASLDWFLSSKSRRPQHTYRPTPPCIDFCHFHTNPDGISAERERRRSLSACWEEASCQTEKRNIAHKDLHLALSLFLHEREMSGSLWEMDIWLQCVSFFLDRIWISMKDCSLFSSPSPPPVFCLIGKPSFHYYSQVCRTSSDSVALPKVFSLVFFWQRVKKNNILCL